jgi:hypothetical protein
LAEVDGVLRAYMDESSPRELATRTANGEKVHVILSKPDVTHKDVPRDKINRLTLVFDRERRELQYSYETASCGILSGHFRIDVNGDQQACFIDASSSCASTEKVAEQILGPFLFRDLPLGASLATAR